jgi:DNA-binding MurR/RpiR family transcriptional regulator
VEQINKAVEIIGTAKHIYTLGTRSSYCIASYLAYHLNRVFQRADILPEDGQLPEYILRIKPGDVLVVANMPRYSRQIFLIVQKAKANGAKIVAITDSELSPYSSIADVHFSAHCRSQDYHNSLLAAFLIAEMLISLLIEKHFEEAKSNIERFEPLYANLGTFLPLGKPN